MYTYLIVSSSIQLNNKKIDHKRIGDVRDESRQYLINGRLARLSTWLDLCLAAGECSKVVGKAVFHQFHQGLAANQTGLALGQNISCNTHHYHRMPRLVAEITT